MRNARQRNRRSERAAASLGKYHPAFTYSQSGIRSPGIVECNSVSIIKCIGDRFRFTIAKICIPRSRPRSDDPTQFEPCTDEFTRCNAKPDQEETQAVNVKYGLRCLTWPRFKTVTSYE